MIKMVSVRGPAIYDYTNGYNVTIGAIEEIQQSSGKMVMVNVTSSSRFELYADSASGNIVTLKAFDRGSGLIAATTSQNFSSVEIGILVDGY